MKEGKRADELLKSYLRWPVFAAVFLVIADICIGFVDIRAGVLMTVFTLIGIFGLIVLYLYSGKNIVRAMTGYAMETENSQLILSKELEIPYALMDENGNFAWKNDEFKRITEGSQKAGNIESILPELDTAGIVKLKAAADYSCEYRGRRYRVHIKRSYTEGVAAFAVYMHDETELSLLKEESINRKLVVGLIYLDNYEEAMESLEEVRRSLLTALIDRKVNQYISSVYGIVKKLEKDKYFFVIKQIHLEQLQKNRFDILEEVKAVNIGNEMSVTVSIGIGFGGDTYAQNYEYARMAIDMALGRGGDQAVVKDQEAIRYFGGKSKTVEKTTRVKARVKAHALRELMDNKDRVIIMGHKRMDIDVFGAAIGIWRISMALNKKASIVTSDINSSLRPIIDRFLGGDYPEDLFISGDKAMELADENTMLVVVDVNRPSITEMPELLKRIKTIVVLDHHRQSSEIIDNAVLSYVETYASSACEMVAEIVQYIADDIRLKQAEADAMYAGIVVDTHNFTNQTGVRTFEAAAFLKRSGADVTRVRKLFREKLEDYRAKAEAIHNAEVYEESFAISECSAEGIESPTVICAQAANELLDIIGVKASIVMTMYNNIVYVSARSIDEINVQVMMEKLGGGGHRSIAGAQLSGVSIPEAREMIKELISDMIKKGEML